MEEPIQFQINTEGDTDVMYQGKKIGEFTKYGTVKIGDKILPVLSNLKKLREEIRKCL